MLLHPTPGIVWSLFLFLTGIFLIVQRRTYSLQTIFCLGLALRLLLLLFPNYLSTDLYRYLWEGHVLRSGFNPYVVAPDSATLLPYHTPYWHLIDHRTLTAIYPPLAQLFFAAIAWSEWSWRLFLILIECCNFFLLFRIVSPMGIPAQRMALYWLLPLTITEISWSGHLEGLLVFLLLLTWRGMIRAKDEHPGHACTVAISLALATLIKYKALFLVPVCGIYFLRQKAYSAILFFVIYVLVVLTGLLPFLDHELSLFHSLGVYLEHWRFNDSLFHLLGFIFQVDWTDTATFSFLKIGLTCCWLSYASWIISRGSSFSATALLLFASYLITSPVVHPWYVLWFAPFLVVQRSNAATLFCLLVPLSYYAEISTGGTLPVWIKLIEYLPVYVLLLYETFQQRTVHKN